MSSPGWTDRELSEYLLGGLPRHKRVRLEQAYLSDADLLEQLELVEDEIVDRYVAGRLSWWTRFRFDRNYLASPPHRERVKQARRLMHALASEPPHHARQTRLIAMVSYAAVVMFLTSACVLLAVRYNQQSEVLQAVRSQTANRETASNERREIVAVPISAFVLYPGTQRSVLDEEQRIQIPERVESIQLRPIVSGDNSQSYLATLTRLDVGQVAGLEGRRNDSLVTITVPARLLADDTYILRLQSLESSFQETYQFSVRLKTTNK